MPYIIRKTLLWLSLFRNELADRFAIVATYLWDPPSSVCLVQLKWSSMSTRLIRSSLMFTWLATSKIHIKIFQFRKSSTRSYRLANTYCMYKHSHINVYRYSFSVIIVNFLEQASNFRCFHLKMTCSFPICNYFDS